MDKEALIAHQEGSAPTPEPVTDWLTSSPKGLGNNYTVCVRHPRYMNIYLTSPEHDKKMEKMVALLRETNALREPILQIQRTVEDIFELIQGSYR